MPRPFIVCHWQKKKAFSCWSPIESFPGTWWFVSLIITSAALSVSVTEQIYTHTHKLMHTLVEVLQHLNSAELRCKAKVSK